MFHEREDAVAVRIPPAEARIARIGWKIHKNKPSAPEVADSCRFPEYMLEH